MRPRCRLWTHGIFCVRTQNFTSPPVVHVLSNCLPEKSVPLIHNPLHSNILKSTKTVSEPRGIQFQLRLRLFYETFSQMTLFSRHHLCPLIVTGWRNKCKLCVSSKPRSSAYTCKRCNWTCCVNCFSPNDTVPTSTRVKVCSGKKTRNN